MALYPLGALVVIVWRKHKFVKYLYGKPWRVLLAFLFCSIPLAIIALGASFDNHVIAIFAAIFSCFINAVAFVAVIDVGCFCCFFDSYAVVRRNLFREKRIDLTKEYVFYSSELV